MGWFGNVVNLASWGGHRVRALADQGEGHVGHRAQLYALGLAHATVRIRNAYGARQLEGRFVMAALTALRRGECFTPQVPDRVRDFCLADDVARHLADVLEGPPGREALREIGSRRALSIAEAARLICRRAAPAHSRRPRPPASKSRSRAMSASLGRANKTQIFERLAWYK